MLNSPNALPEWRRAFAQFRCAVLQLISTQPPSFPVRPPDSMNSHAKAHAVGASVMAEAAGVTEGIQMSTANQLLLQFVSATGRASGEIR
jgi:hypothetical protein